MKQGGNIQKSIFRDQDFILLNINAFLVVAGYGIAVYTDLASVPFMKVVKIFFLVFSTIVLLKDMKLHKKAIPSPGIIYILIFCFWVFLMSFFSKNVTASISTSMNFLFPFIYVYIALHNLLNKFRAIDLIKAFIKSFNFVYFLPILAYLFSGAGFGQVNIYGFGETGGQFFISNQYGWACSIYLISSVDLLLNGKPGKYYKAFLIITMFIGLYIVLISGNRASWLAVLLATLIFILRLKNIRIDFKIIFAVALITGIVWFYQIPDSSLQIRLSDTEAQIDEGEARMNTANLGFNKFNENKLLWITGAGMFNYEEIIHGEGLGDYHNSYLEILFGGGIILFLMFIIFILIRPLYFYITYYSKYFLIIPPLLVIPFFESNLTGGQFIFFPWFVFMLLFNMPPKYDDYKLENSDFFYNRQKVKYYP